MKYLGLVLLILVTACSKENISQKEVPETVKAKFATLYPSVSDLDWSMEDSNYEAEFEEGKFETSVIFTPGAEVVQTENEILQSEIPDAILHYVDYNLNGKRIKEAEKITKGQGGKTEISYSLEIGKYNYIFDAAGNFLRKESDND